MYKGGEGVPFLRPKERGEGVCSCLSIGQTWKKIESKGSLREKPNTRPQEPQAIQATMQAIQAIQARQIGIQANVPVLPTAASQEGIETPLVSCYECDAVWYSTECTRCPRCARQVGTHWDLNEEETCELMSAVKLLDEERIERASEYETWAFGNILRKHVSFYNETCPRTIQTCYEALLKQPSNLKIAFAMEFFKEAYLVAPEDEMMYHFDDEDEEDHYNSDVDEWW